MNIAEFGEHFRIAPKELQALNRLQAIDFITMMPKLGWDTEIKTSNSLALMYYIDEYGDFTENKTNHNIIANAMFKSLDDHRKIEIMMYLLWTHGDEDES